MSSVSAKACSFSCRDAPAEESTPNDLEFGLKSDENACMQYVPCSILNTLKKL